LSGSVMIMLGSDCIHKGAPDGRMRELSWDLTAESFSASCHIDPRSGALIGSAKGAYYRG